MGQKYKCPKCQTKCGEKNIYGCDQFRCPRCGHIFEPESYD